MTPKAIIKKVFSSNFWWGAGANQSTIPDKQPQAATSSTLLPGQSFGPGFHPPGDTRFTGGKTARGLDSYYGFKIIDHYGARSQARKIDIESVEAHTLLKRNNSYTIGRGLRRKSTPDFRKLGITREEATEWAKAFDSAFNTWAKSSDSDVTGVNNFYQNTAFAHLQVSRDGEGLPRFSYSDDPELLNPLQIGFLDPNQIMGDEFTFTSGPISQDTGLIPDKNGKTIGFKVWIVDNENKTSGQNAATIPTFRQSGAIKLVEVPAKDKESGLPIMLHMFKPTYPGQKRGIPKLFHAIQDFQDITGYHKAALQRMENGALINFTAFNKQQDPGDFGMSDLSDDPAGVTTKTPTESSGAPSAPSAEVVTCTAIPEATVHETGINVFEAKQGDELKGTPDLSPGETAKDFIDGRISNIAPSMGMSPEVAAMRTNSSFTAAKGAFGMQDNEADIERDDIVADFADHVVFAWMFGEVASGRMSAPGFSSPHLRAAWLQGHWIAGPPIVLNPQQEATAAKINVELGREDLATSAENLNGSNFESNAAKLTEQLEQLPTDPYALNEEIEPIPDGDPPEDKPDNEDK